MRAARGALVSFVDGDDVVSPHYLAMLHGAHGGAPGRMVVGGSRRMRRDDVGTVDWPQGHVGSKTLSRDEAIRAYLLEEIGSVAWGRLAPRDLYPREPFEPGAIYEDSIAPPSHLSATDEVLILDARIYGYIAREGSLSDPRATSPAHVRGRVRTIEHLCEVALTWPTKHRQLSVWRLDRCLVGLVNISARLTDRERARICRGLAREAIARDLPRLLEVRKGERLPWQLPAAAIVALASPRLLHAIARLFRRR